MSGFPVLSMKALQKVNLINDFAVFKLNCSLSVEQGGICWRD